MNKFIDYLIDPYKIAFGIVRRMAPFIKNDVDYLKILYYLRHHERLSLDNPQTFPEKIQWLKLYNKKPNYTRMVDKAAVKDYVASIIGEEFIIPTIGLWDKPDDIDSDKLPEKFVLKTTHGGGSVGVVICRDKQSFDQRKAIKRLKRALKQNVYVELREWPYKDVKPQIIAEQYMEDKGNEELVDYKFYCFDGKAEYCQVIGDRHTDETIDFYDRNWKHQPFIGMSRTAHHAPKTHNVPREYTKMLSVADRLASHINSPFVRIDLYDINDRIYFGEITFFPASGLGCIRPEEWNHKLGSMLNLTNC